MPSPNAFMRGSKKGFDVLHIGDKIYEMFIGRLEKYAAYGVMTGVRPRSVVDRSTNGLSPRLPGVAPVSQVVA